MVDFLSGIIEMFYNWTGNFGVAVILFTVLVKLILLFPDIKGKSSTAKMQALAPEVQRINEKYANDPEKKNKKTMELYSKNHVSPLGGCLPLLLTFPIIILMFMALKNIASNFMYQYMEDLILANRPELNDFLVNIANMINESSEIKTAFKDILPQLVNNKGELTSALSKLPEVITEENWLILSDAIKSITFEQAQAAATEAGYSFLWIKNIWAPDSPFTTILGTSTFGNTGFLGLFNASVFPVFVNGWFLLPILATAGQYVQTWLTTKQTKNAAPAKNNKKAEANPADTMKMMNKFLPLITLYFCATFNSAFAIYYTISSLVSIAQSLVMDYLKARKEKKTQEVVNL